MTRTLVPTASRQRIDTLDVIRGVAVCGILLINVVAMGSIGDAETPRSAPGWNPDWIAWGLQSTLAEGTMRGLFSMLFGAGMVMMLGKAGEDDGAAVWLWVRRCIGLLALGIAQFAVFLWPGEILWCYGWAGLLLLLLRKAEPRQLVALAAIILIMLSAYKTFEASGRVRTLEVAAAAIARGGPETEQERRVVAARAEYAAYLHPSAEAVAAEKAQRTSFPGVLLWSEEKWAEWNLRADSWTWLFETVAFMAIGMMLFRTGVLTGAAPPAVYRAMVAVGYGIGIPLRLATLAMMGRHGFVTDLDHPDALLMMWEEGVYEPARLLITMGHIGAVVLLLRGGALGQARPLRALGRMALTVYSLQSVLTSVLFYGFGVLGAIGFAGLMGIAAGIWVLTALFCLAWLRRFPMGPMEWMLRRVSYGPHPRNARSP
ncbi:DUF418 domain-containing protein [Sphingomonas sp. ID0503]|uniref:DUF418 domain-containing protein n=1 Tax=Sphingomonas sp. ID0503 TaxID=3399691 RepID=UPI003AFAA95C